MIDDLPNEVLRPLLTLDIDGRVVRLVCRRWHDIAEASFWGLWVATPSRLDQQIDMLEADQSRVRLIRCFCFHTYDLSKEQAEAIDERPFVRAGRCAAQWDWGSGLQTLVARGSTAAVYDALLHLFSGIASHQHPDLKRILLMVGRDAGYDLSAPMKTLVSVAPSLCTLHMSATPLWSIEPLTAPPMSSLSEISLQVTQMSPGAMSVFEALLENVERAILTVLNGARSDVASRLCAAAIRSKQLQYLQSSYTVSIGLLDALKTRADLRCLETSYQGVTTVQVYRFDATLLKLEATTSPIACGQALAYLRAGHAPHLRRLIRYFHPSAASDAAASELEAYCRERGIQYSSIPCVKRCEGTGLTACRSSV